MVQMFLPHASVATIGFLREYFLMRRGGRGASENANCFLLYGLKQLSLFFILLCQFSRVHLMKREPNGAIA